MLLGTLVPVVENLVLVVLPHGGQRQARCNAWLAMVEGSAPSEDRHDHPGYQSSRLQAGAQ